MASHLVTGGCGFLGNLIARRLLEQGEKVKVLDIWKDTSLPSDIEFINCDVRNSEGIAKALKGVDYVHHNAALVPLTKSGKKFWDVNVNGSKIVAEEAAKSGVGFFIHMSSSAVFGLPQNCPITDSTSFRPVEIYGRAKLAGELAVQSTCNNYGMNLIIVRPRTLLGLGRLGIFQILFEWIKENRKIYIIGNGDIKFQFVHALDLLDFYMLAVKKKLPGTYNVGTDRFGTLREVLENLISYAGSRSKVTGLPVWLAINVLSTLDLLNLSPLAPWHYLTYHKDFYFDVEPLLKLGWKPKYSNDEMFKESYDWFTYNFDKFNKFEGLSPHRKIVKEKLLSLLKRLS